MIRCSAPGRAGIIGNPTDMYGGSVISCSTQERATATVEPWDALVLEISGKRKQLRGKEDLALSHDYFDIARTVIEFVGLSDAKFKLTTQGEIPFQAGLSGSTAMLVAILNALLCFSEKPCHRFRAAEMARHIELNYLKVVCGYQDAYMCTFGGLHYMDFREKEFYRGLGEEPYGTMESLASYVGTLPFVLAHTGVQRISGSVHKPIRDRWLEGDRKVVRGYLRMAHLARMGKKAVLDQDWEWLGELMNENHDI
ncbi:MAG: galactokinase family protein [Candidatus Latescibacterota bacterium]